MSLKCEPAGERGSIPAWCKERRALVVLGGGAVSYERGAPVPPLLAYIGRV